jgi:hypothetical protein
MTGKYYKKNYEFLELANPLDTAVRKILIPFLFLIALIAYLFSLNYPLMAIFMILLIYVLISGAAFWIIGEGLIAADLVYFILLAIDCVLLAFTLYFTGGIESFVYVLFGIIGLMAGLTLPLWGMAGIISLAIISYFSELALEFFEVIPHISIFKGFISPVHYDQFLYVIIIPLSNMAAFLISAVMAYTIAGILRKREEKLALANQQLDDNARLLSQRSEEVNKINQILDLKVKELEELKNSLEQKVAERTRELAEAKNGLEKEVAKQTDELRKERDTLDERIKLRTAQLEEKLNELQNIVNASVGRELKMIELENQIEELKKQAPK